MVWLVCRTAYAKANTATAMQIVATILCLVRTGPLKEVVEGSGLGVCGTRQICDLCITECSQDRIMMGFAGAWLHQQGLMPKM